MKLAISAAKLSERMKKVPEPVRLALVALATLIGAIVGKLTIDAIFHRPAPTPPNYLWLIWIGFFAIFLIPPFFKALNRDSEQRAEQLAEEALAEAKAQEDANQPASE